MVEHRFGAAAAKLERVVGERASAGRWGVAAVAQGHVGERAGPEPYIVRRPGTPSRGLPADTRFPEAWPKQWVGRHSSQLRLDQPSVNTPPCHNPAALDGVTSVKSNSDVGLQWAWTIAAGVTPGTLTRRISPGCGGPNPLFEI